jgi:nitrate reductase NapAB chaperone NapD
VGFFMLISGVVILTEKDKTEAVFEALQSRDGVTTYGIHKEFYIVAVLESETSKGLEALTNQISDSIQGIVGVYPAYINFEADIEEK